MARIPEEEIRRLQKEIPIERVVSGFGVELKRVGANLMGVCPFHDDHTPSLAVTPETNLWHCLGKCSEGGGVIEWVMKTKGLSFRHAVELLKADHPSLVAGDGRVVRQGTRPLLASPVAVNADDQQSLRDVVRFYHETLKESPEALRYLESRGLTHPEMIGRFQLGFANRKLGLTLPEKNRKAGADLRGRLERLGILRESGHEHMNGSVVFPIFDLDGNVLGMYGRKITEGLRPGTPLHLYLPGPHRGVWNEEALIASKEIILCESIIDALTFWCAGFRNVTASYGVNGFTEDHRTAFQKHGVEQVWIAYDRDAAGDEAAERLKEELLKLGIGSHRVLFPHGMDANEYGRRVQPAAQSLAVLLNGAAWWGGQWPGASVQGADEPTQPTKHPATDPSPLATGHGDEVAVVPDPQDAPRPDGTAANQTLTTGPSPLTTGRGDEVTVASLPTGPSPLTTGRGDEVTVAFGDRRYRIRGLEKNLSPELLKVNILVARQENFHVDTIDLCQDRQRAAFIKRASEELGIAEEIVRKDVGRVYWKLEELQREAIQKALAPAKPEAQMSNEDREAALALLKEPRLLERIQEDFDRCGLVGEKDNKLIGYLAAVSRHLESPLAVLVQSSSAAGKSTLMDAVLAFVPEEEAIRFSAMTEQSLYYMGGMDLKHKVLAIAEEEGASRAAYALKLLQSEGVLSIASTGKDPTTGKLVTHQYRVEGPVMMFLTTTAIDIGEELLNRCLVLSVNEDREQTQAIHRLQREAQTLEGLIRRQKRRDIIRLHQNAQRLLKLLAVVNPFVDRMTFPDKLTRMRRDHMKYLTLIRAIALLHQYQRPVRNAPGFSYIEATEQDIAAAGRLMNELLRRSLDELPSQTRRLLGLIDEMVKAECQRLGVERKDFRFSRRDVRGYTEWSATQIRVHMDRLEEMEYVIAHHGRRGQTFVYELAFEAGEIHGYDLNLAGLEGQLAGSKRPQNGGLAATWRPHETRVNTASSGVFHAEGQNAY